MSSLRVLLVAGHHEARRELRYLLELWGYEVCDAVTGAAALETASVFRPEVAVIDLDTPGHPDVYDVARALEDSPEHPLLIACGSPLTEHVRRWAHEAGFHFVVAKVGGTDHLRALLAAAETQSLRRAK